MNSQLTSMRDPNSTADTAWACTVYSLVPYLGILFVPFALALSGFGFSRAVSRDRRPFLLSAAASLVILIVQLLLWWLLYLIPERGL